MIDSTPYSSSFNLNLNLNLITNLNLNLNFLDPNYSDQNFPSTYTTSIKPSKFVTSVLSALNTSNTNLAKNNNEESQIRLENLTYDEFESVFGGKLK